MPVMDGWNLTVEVDDVLRGQGADPAKIRARSPLLVQIAARAIEAGSALIHPRVAYQRYPVESVRHNRVSFAGGGVLKGELLVQHLAPASEVVILACTIGPALEELASRQMETDMIQGLALYGMGSAAVEALANAACRRFEDEAALQGWQTTIPLSPGMIGWPVDEGQAQIFSLIDGSAIGVTLMESAIMKPVKSLSMVLGLGPEIGHKGVTCDYCAMRESCKYQTHYTRPE